MRFQILGLLVVNLLLSQFAFGADRFTNDLDPDARLGLTYINALKEAEGRTQVRQSPADFAASLDAAMAMGRKTVPSNVSDLVISDDPINKVSWSRFIRAAYSFSAGSMKRNAAVDLRQIVAYFNFPSVTSGDKLDLLTKSLVSQLATARQADFLAIMNLAVDIQADLPVDRAKKMRLLNLLGALDLVGPLLADDLEITDLPFTRVLVESLGGDLNLLRPRMNALVKADFSLNSADGRALTKLTLLSAMMVISDPFKVNTPHQLWLKQLEDQNNVIRAAVANGRRHSGFDKPVCRALFER